MNKYKVCSLVIIEKPVWLNRTYMEPKLGLERSAGTTQKILWMSDCEMYTYSVVNREALMVLSRKGRYMTRTFFRKTVTILCWIN